MRGAFRGGGRMRGGFGGPFGSNRSYPFDIYNSNDVFDKIEEDIELNQKLQQYADKLTPNAEQKKQLEGFLDKVKSALNDVLKSEEFKNVEVGDVQNVGSFAKDTLLAGHNTADIAVLLNTVPAVDLVFNIGSRVADKIRTADFIIVFRTDDFGCELATTDMKVRILFTTSQANSGKLEKDIHISEEFAKIGFNSVLHTFWFNENVHIPAVRALIRIMKDLRTKLPILDKIRCWPLEFYCFVCVKTARSVLSLGKAFRRFFELIAGGAVLHYTAGLLDPVETYYRFGSEFDMEYSDRLTSAAQVILNIINVGGIDMLLSPLGLDLTKPINVKGIIVKPIETVYFDGCMGAKEDEETDPAVSQ